MLSELLSFWRVFSQKIRKFEITFWACVALQTPSSCNFMLYRPSLIEVFDALEINLLSWPTLLEKEIKETLWKHCGGRNSPVNSKWIPFRIPMIVLLGQEKVEGILFVLVPIAYPKTLDLSLEIHLERRSAKLLRCTKSLPFLERLLRFSIPDFWSVI